MRDLYEHACLGGRSYQDVPLGKSFVSSADIEPNALANPLAIKIHRIASPAHDRAFAALLEKLALQNILHPETGGNNDLLSRLSMTSRNASCINLQCNLTK